jgi:transcriptional regulator with XRE-family HTH domain
MDMISELKRIQKKRKLTDPIMAEKLGITRAWWNFIKNGRQPLTERIKRNAYNAFPDELRDIFLSNNNTPRVVNQ